MTGELVGGHAAEVVRIVVIIAVCVAGSSATYLHMRMRHHLPEGVRAVHTGLSLFLLATAVSTITNLAVHQPLTPGYYFTVAAALVAAPILLRAVWSDLHSDTDTKER